MLVFENLETFIGIIQILIELFIHFQYNLIFGTPRKSFEYEFPISHIEATNTLARNRFPESFFFGITTSYQREGVWHVSGKFMWDVSMHQSYISCDINDEFTCDSYPTYEEDIELAINLKATMLKIPLHWSLILPSGFASPINEDIMEHYNDVLDEILEHGITPMVTLFQTDTPYILQQLGGWANPMIVEWFAAYAEIVFTAFGHKIKYWITMEDPVTLCRYNTSTQLSGTADYLCSRHALLAHAKVYNLYREKFQSTQKGKVGIVHNYTWFEPENSSSAMDVGAVETAFQWYNGWMTNPLFGKNGDYPKMMKDRVAFKSRFQKFPESRLPRFTELQISQIKRTADFLGINFYTAKRVRGLKISVNDISFDRDADILIVPTKNSSSEKNVSWALQKLLRRLNNDYLLPEIYLTGHGYKDDGKIDGGIAYYEQHIREVLNAMQAGLDIRGYLARNLIDNFYLKRDPSISSDINLTRHPKLSSSVLHDIYRTKTIRSMTEITQSMIDP